jgi:hypothetical protein
MLIWHATLRCMWKVRNNSIFVSHSFLPPVIVDEIKVISWKWSLARLKILPCLFYEWSWNPDDCHLRWVVLGHDWEVFCCVYCYFIYGSFFFLPVSLLYCF